MILVFFDIYIYITPYRLLACAELNFMNYLLCKIICLYCYVYIYTPLMFYDIVLP